MSPPQKPLMMTLSKKHLLILMLAIKIASKTFCFVLSQHLLYSEKVCLLVYFLSPLEYKLLEVRDLVGFVQHFNLQSTEGLAHKCSVNIYSMNEVSLPCGTLMSLSAG